MTGISHVLEHMMFKGTPQHPAGAFARLIAEQGGQENAFTSRDSTAYFERLERSQLALSFALEADRMQHLLLAAEAFATEIQVVQEERRLRTTDQPRALTQEYFYAVAFLHSPIPPASDRLDERPRIPDGGPATRVVPALVRAE
jgi:zinc protease